MKKKVLSVALASALFVGAAASASAVVWGNWDSSSKSGDSNDITALAFTESSYTIRNGSDKDLSEVLTAYAGNDAIVQEPELEWEITDNDLVFDLNTVDNKAVISVYENSGTATVTVSSDNGKKATCKVVAAPLIKATGFKFENSSYTIPTGTYVANKSISFVPDGIVDNKTVKLVATPNDATLSDPQKKSFANMDVVLVASRVVEPEIDAVAAAIDRFDGSYAKDEVIAIAPAGSEKGEFTFTDDDLANVYAGVTNARLAVVTHGALSVGDVFDGSKDYAKVVFPAFDADKTEKTISRDVRASTELARAATRAGRTGSITIEVGQTAEIGKFVKYGPTNANVGKDIGDWTIDYYNSASTDDDYAVLNDGRDKILGVAVGRVKVVATFRPIDGGDTTEVEIPVNVVARGASSKPETPVATTESATLAIGGTYWAESGNENTEWTVDNDNVTIVPEKGAGCKIFAKKAGTATVTGTVDGEVVKTVNVTITAAGATTPDVPTEANPSTGDSLLAFLF